jgi:serine/threonine-protein kinase
LRLWLAQQALPAQAESNEPATGDPAELPMPPRRHARLFVAVAVGVALAVALGGLLALRPSASTSTAAELAITPPSAAPTAAPLAAAAPAVDAKTTTDHAHAATAQPAQPAQPAAAPSEPPPALATPKARKPTAKPAPTVAAAAVTPVLAQGVLNIAISPWGQVEVNGAAVGTTPPLTRLELPQGTHTITVRNEDFPPYTQRVQVDPERPVTLKHRFGS